MRNTLLLFTLLAIVLTGCNMPVANENSTMVSPEEVNKFPYPDIAEIRSIWKTTGLGKFSAGSMIQFGLVPQLTLSTTTGSKRAFYVYVTHDLGSDEWGYVTETLELVGGELRSIDVQVEASTWEINDGVSGGIEFTVADGESISIYVTHHDREFGDVSFNRRFEKGTHSLILPPLEYAVSVSNYETGSEEIQSISITSGMLRKYHSSSTLQQNVAAVYQVGNIPGSGDCKVYVTVKDGGQETRYHRFVLPAGHDEVSIPSTFKLSEEGTITLSVSRNSVLTDDGYSYLHIFEQSDFTLVGQNDHGVPMFGAEYNEKG